MFEQSWYECPVCSAEVRRKLSGGEALTCPGCRRQFAVMGDEASGRIGLVEVGANPVPEPLFLPRGSIRAAVTIMVSATCWCLMWRDAFVPGYLLSLLLTMIGYYFGFRQKAKAAQSRIYDASAQDRDPLFAPAGLIRFLLVAGFGVTAILLYARGTLEYPVYLEFFVVLAGLIGGYILNRTLRRWRLTAAYATFGHLKGAAVIVCSAWLCVELLRRGAPAMSGVPLLMAAVISFYFGARS